MSKNKIKLNIQNIKALPIPTDGKRTYHYDNKVPGLGIMIFPSGTKTFFLYKRVDGKPDKIKLGRFPDMSPEQAVNAAYKLMGEISEGANPNNDKKKFRAEMTFDKLFDRYLNEYAKPHKISWTDDLYYYQKFLNKFDKKKISDINRQDIEKMHNHVKEVSGLYAANRLLALTSKIFNKAIDWGFEGINPALRIKKFKEQSRDRALQATEIGAFFEALNEEPNLILKSYFYMSLLTGARRSNILSMRWDQITFGDPTEWKIPLTKNGESHTVILVPQAVEILNELKGLFDSPWVFFSQASKSGHIEEPKSAWKRILTRADITDLRIHDLRRTLASWQVKTGASSFVIGKTLGHKDKHATAIYARVSKDVARESMENAVNEMFKYSN